ncbi:uncharacterized protein LOC124111267 [Haliotis rufescens]|uniref:uncharacterized protein LOC124111267 n=1 Tax=Haliotis rufescens TaxID=6454 RepID=UPI001EB008FA|nr:uncharacterized protein LOC124111267 [Haliotis rufescens]
MKVLVILAVVVVVASARTLTRAKRSNKNHDNNVMNAAKSIIASANDVAGDKQNNKDKRDYEYYYAKYNYDNYGLYAVGAVVDYGYVDYSETGLYYYDVSQDDINQKLAAKEAKKQTEGAE